jgi:hypothetical protein
VGEVLGCVVADENATPVGSTNTMTTSPRSGDDWSSSSKRLNTGEAIVRV